MLLGVLAAHAADVTGYVEARASWNGGVDGVPWEANQRVRPTFEGALHERIDLVATPQIALAQGRNPVAEGYRLLDEQVGAILETAGCDLDAPARYNSVDDVLTVERLYLDLYHPRIDVRVGRQALNWGSAAFFNPTDLFAQNLIATPWLERAGVDAVRATAPIGERHQVVAVAALDRGLDHGRFGIRPTFNVLQTDISPVLGYVTGGADSAGTPSAGLDLRGQMVVGWWVEAGADWIPETDLGDVQPRASVGLDYSLPVLDQFIVLAQYSYDGTGVEDPRLYSLLDRGLSVATPDCLSDDAFPPPGAPRFTIGRHYALVSVRAAAFDAWTLTASGLMNLQDRSTMVLPSLAWTPGDRWTATVGGTVGVGEGEFVPTDAMARFDYGLLSLDGAGLVPRWSGYATVRFAL